MFLFQEILTTIALCAWLLLHSLTSNFKGYNVIKEAFLLRRRGSRREQGQLGTVYVVMEFESSNPRSHYFGWSRRRSLRRLLCRKIGGECASTHDSASGDPGIDCCYRGFVQIYFNHRVAIWPLPWPVKSVQRRGFCTTTIIMVTTTTSSLFPPYTFWDRTCHVLFLNRPLDCGDSYAYGWIRGY